MTSRSVLDYIRISLVLSMVPGWIACKNPSSLRKRGKCYSHFTSIHETELVQLSEVLDGANHLRGVAVLVVVPGHNLHLIGVEAAMRLPVSLSGTSNVGKNVNKWQKRLPYQAPHGLSYHSYSLSHQQSECNFLSNVVNILCLCIYNIYPLNHQKAAEVFKHSAV